MCRTRYYGYIQSLRRVIEKMRHSRSGAFIGLLEILVTHIGRGVTSISTGDTRN